VTSRVHGATLISMKTPLILAGVLALAIGAPATPGIAQTTDQRAAILAVTDSALAAINRGDMAMLTELMISEAFTMPVRDSTRFTVRSRDEVRMQAMGGIIERGFRPTVQISGPLAVVWLPYDLYVEGVWSHCGVDAFTLVQTGATWKIAVLAWTIEQPPACESHPDGPPAR